MSPSTTTQHDRISAARAILVRGLYSSLQRLRMTVDHLLPPETQEKLKHALVSFATSHPILATLLLSQAVFSVIPLFLFLLFTASIFVFSLMFALVLGFLGTLAITLLCMGLGSIILIPTLCLATLTASGVWGWGWGLYYIVQWVGSGDTALLTRFSLLLAPHQKAWTNNDSDERMRLEKDNDQEQSLKLEHIGNDKQSEVQSHGSNGAMTDVQTSGKSNGYPEIEINGV